jgi:hypothetical protein
MYTLEELLIGLNHMEKNYNLAMDAGDSRLASAFNDKITWLNAELDRRIDDHYEDINYLEEEEL